MADAERYDAVVVGSGFGGSVTAYRLAEAGWSVLVLERGRPYPPGSFPRAPRGLRGAFWDPAAGLHGMIELLAFSRLKVLVASGLGGGSLIYANVMLPKDADTFVREDLDDGGLEYWPITRKHLEPHYRNVKAMQRPKRFPIAHEPYAATPKTQAMLGVARQLSLDAERPPLAISFAPRDGAPPAPGEPIYEEHGNLHGRPRQTCRLCGECDVGCNYGSKNTLDFTYLSAARRAGAVIRTCCEVRTLTPPGEGRDEYAVRYRQHLPARAGCDRDLLDPTEEPKRTVLARHVVLAAGTLGSTSLLLRNRTSLPRLSARLGTAFCTNGDYLYYARQCERLDSHGRPAPRYLDSSVGPVITTTARVPGGRGGSGRPHIVQDGGGPALNEWAFHGPEVPGDLWRMRRVIARALLDRLRRRPVRLSGADIARGLGTASASAATLPLLAMGRDVPDGRILLRGDALDVDWRLDAGSRRYYEDVEATLADVGQALGERKRARLPSLTVHPLGGCPMGVDARRGVVDKWGRVFGYPGLHVADGSVMPGPVGVNPSFTIAAVADRFAEHMLEP